MCTCLFIFRTWHKKYKALPERITKKYEAVPSYFLHTHKITWDKSIIYGRQHSLFFIHGPVFPFSFFFHFSLFFLDSETIEKGHANKTIERQNDRKKNKIQFSLSWVRNEKLALLLKQTKANEKKERLIFINKKIRVVCCFFLVFLNEFLLGGIKYLTCFT